MTQRLVTDGQDGTQRGHELRFSPLHHRNCAHRRSDGAARAGELAVTAEGTFQPLDTEALEAQYGTLRLDHAAVIIGASDSRGLRSAEFAWDGRAIPLESGGEPFGDPALQGPSHTVAAILLLMLGVVVTATRKLTPEAVEGGG